MLVSSTAYPQDIQRAAALPYKIVHTGVTDCYSNDAKISKPKPGEPFFGQDGNYIINPPSYTDNGDGTVTDNVTGLMWQKDMGAKIVFDDAQKEAKNLKLAGYADWRVPSLKEVISLVQFNGRVRGPKVVTLFIDTNYFNQPLGDTGRGEREIDAQTWSSTEYLGRTMGNDESVFGVNFIDGRVKAYPKYHPRTGQPNKMYFRFVRGNNAYGKNNFIDNGDGTVTDMATGLMWQQSDSRKGLNWEEALQYAQRLDLASFDDWRLPNAKELNSIVDYSRSIQTTGTAAIGPVFATTQIADPQGKKQFPHFWTSTVLMDGPNPYSFAAYIPFGAAQGRMHGRLLDAHGAGALRSDPKAGRKEEYPQYFGPQGDIRYVYNFVRCVRNVTQPLTTN